MRRQSRRPSVHLATLLSLRAVLRPDDYDELIHAALSVNEWREGNVLREVISVSNDAFNSVAKRNGDLPFRMETNIRGSKTSEYSFTAECSAFCRIFGHFTEYMAN